MDDNAIDAAHDERRKRVVPGDALIGVGLTLLVIGVGLWSLSGGIITAGLCFVIAGVAWHRAHPPSDVRDTDPLAREGPR